MSAGKYAFPERDESAGGTDYWGLRIPFMEALGLVPEEIGENYARTRLPYRNDLLNSRGHVHGGTLMSVLDFTLSAAARGAMMGELGVATIDMSTSFMEPGLTELVIEGRCLRRGKSIAFCEGEIRDTEGRLLCKASATFKLMQAKGGD